MFLDGADLQEQAHWLHLQDRTICFTKHMTSCFVGSPIFHLLTKPIKNSREMRVDGWTFTLSHAVHQSRRQDTLDGLAKWDRLQTEWNAFLNPFDQRYYEKVREIAESGTGG
jgi:hypothetical protein